MASKRLRRSPQQIRGILRRFSQSGLSRVEFADSEGIPVSTLDAWRRKFPLPTTQWMEIPASVLPSAQPATLVLEGPTGLRLSFPSHLRPDEIREWINLLGSCSA